MSYILDIKPGDRHIFLHIPKNGGMSVVTALKKYNRSPSFQTRLNPNMKGHFSYLETEKIIDKKPSGFIYFCTIRNPWERMVSFYTYTGQNKATVSGFYKLHEAISSGMTFDEFVPAFIEDERREFRPQIDYIVDEDGELAFDNFLMLDNIESGLVKFLTDMKAPGAGSVGVKKINTSTHKHYKEFYTSQETIDIVADYEKGIIDKFNFEF